MTASEAGPGPRTTSTLARVLLGILAVSEALIGGWALFAPASFYRSFPAAGHGWVALLPPYNEHLIRDVGSLSLALTVALAAAAVTGQSLLSAVAVGAFAVYAVPNMIFHGFHLEGLQRGGCRCPDGGLLAPAPGGRCCHLAALARPCSD